MKNNAMDYKRTIGSVTFLFILSGLVMSKQLLSTTYFSCFISDSYQYASWAGQFIASLREGISYPRWTPVNFWGYGSPTFILYPPLAFYLVALFNSLTASIVTSMNLTKFLSLFASSLGVFYLTKEMYSERVALLTASFNALLPLYVFNVYIGGAFTSSISLMWFPFILVFVYRYVRTGEGVQLIYSGMCYGGLILTHLINAYMFGFVIAAFLCCFAISTKRLRYLAGIPVIFVVGILISAAYLFPFVFEKHLINYQSVIKNFPLSDLFILPRHTERLRPGFFWAAFYSSYVFHFIFFLIMTLLLVCHMMKSSYPNTVDKPAITEKFLIGTSLLSIFLLFGPSSFIWHNVPYFKYINIPARWLNITAFAVVLLSASGFSILKEIHDPKRGWYSLFGIIFVICVLQDYGYVRSSCVFDERELSPAKAINWLPEHLPAGVDFHKLDMVRNPEGRVFIAKGEGKIKVESWRSAERLIRVMADGPVTLRIRTFYFPGWTAFMDKSEARIEKERDTDAMLIDVPSGTHTLDLKFLDTPIRFYSKIVSMVSFIALVFTLVFLRKKGNIDK